MHRRRADFRTVVAVGVLGGLVALLAPILIGEILVRIIPRADILLWIAALGALVLVAFGTAVFEIVRGLALLRIEGRIDERLQSAIWSRLRALPAPFFREFTAGDLADRANGIGEIRQMLTGAAVQAAMGGIFSVFSLALLFLNIHLHLLVLDGAYPFTAGRARFHRAGVSTNDEIERLLDVLIGRIVRTLTRAQALVAGPEEEGAQPYLHLERPDDEALATLERAAVRYRIALGPMAGRKTLRLQIPGATGIAVQAATPLTATRDGSR